jgi:hypothetical protein
MILSTVKTAIFGGRSGQFLHKNLPHTTNVAMLLTTKLSNDFLIKIAQDKF